MIVVANQNKTKLLAVKNVFACDNLRSFNVDSNVSEKPVNQAVFKGAENRVKNLLKQLSEKDIDLFKKIISIEGGLVNLGDEWFSLSVASILSNNENKIYTGASDLIKVPNSVYECAERDIDITSLIANGSEHYQGISGYLTDGAIDRIKTFEQALLRYLENTNSVEALITQKNRIHKIENDKFNRFDSLCKQKLEVAK